MTRTLRIGLACFPLLLFGCTSEDGGEGGGGGGSDPDAAVSGPADAADPPANFETLVTATWSIPAGSEKYYCARKTVTEDTYVRILRAIAPTGTHHTVVTVDDPDGPDGEFACEAGTLTDNMLFASGVGTDRMTFPEGVAVKIPAGKQVTLNLHLYNVSDVEITGTSGTEVAVLPADEVTDEAEMVFGGKFFLSIGTGERSESGNCAIRKDATISSVWPHMHQYGVHMKVVLERPGVEDFIIHDEAYSFFEQVNWDIEPLVVRNGDNIKTTCTWNNTSGRPITFGDSSDNEMCFAGLYRYPASNEGKFCTEIQP